MVVNTGARLQTGEYEMVITVGSKSHPGRRRRRNEDSVLVAPAETVARPWSLFAVADGMGGAPAGHLASAAAITALQLGVERHASPRPGELLAAAFSLVNTAVRAFAASHSRYAGAGTTLVAALVDGSQAWVANVGDSRAYLIRSQSHEQITRDHSWLEEEIRAGLLTRESESAHRHILTRSLGGAEDVAVDVFGPIGLVEGDRVVLCSDGLHVHVVGDELATIVNSLPPQEAAERLVELANARGGTDNISVIVLAVVPAPVTERSGGWR
jgi:serine/threonine protein phosphatase PrpC